MKQIQTITQFQFQLGAIGRAGVNKADVDFCLFQFQLGAIGSARDIFMMMFYLSFNSSLVRLGGSCERLQSCCGSSFNSSLVRLGEQQQHQPDLLIQVSIPAWCDWERVLLHRTE